MAGFVPPATTGDVGAVQPDGTTILVDVDGTIRAHVATTTAPGIVQPDGEVITILDGVITVPLATPVALGVVMPDGVTIIEPIPGQIAAATATTGQLGVVQPDGTSIDVDGAGIISTAPLHITDGTHDVHPTRQVTFADATVSGTAPDAIVTPHTATTARLGIVQPDGSSILVDGAGVISAADQGVAVTEDDITIYQATKVRFADAHVTGPAPNVLVTPHTASAGQLGVVQPDGTTIVVDGAGVISAAPPEPLLSIVDGDGTRVDGVLILLVPDSTVAVTPAVSGGATLTINEASDSHLGLAQADGTTITASSGVLSATATGLPTGAQGDIAHHGAGVWGVLPAGAAGDVLTSDGTDVAYQPARIGIDTDGAPAGTRHSLDLTSDDGDIVITPTDDGAGDAVHVDLALNPDLLAAIRGGGAAVTVYSAPTASVASSKALSLWTGGTNGAPPTNWQTTGFDDSGWSAALYVLGAAPDFIWPETTPLSATEQALFRQTFTPPAGTITGASITASCDDYLLGIYINGTLLAGSIQSAGAGAGSVTIGISPGLLHPGASNLIACHGANFAGVVAHDANIGWTLTITYNATGGGSLPGSLAIAKDGTAIGTEPTLNLITGTGTTLTVVDDPGNSRVDVTITAEGGGGALATQSSYISSPVAVGTTYSDIATLDLTAGTYLVIGTAEFDGAGSSNDISIRITDGTTTYAVLGDHVGFGATLVATAAITLTGSATIHLQARTSGGAASVVAESNTSGSDTTHAVSGLVAVAGGGGGGSGGITVEDGTHTVAAATAIEFTGATVSGSTPTADVTIPDLAASGSGHHAGLAPDPGATAGSMKFLREDATWAVPGVAASLTVDDGTTTVEDVASLSFSGASVAAAGAGATVIIVPTISHGSASLLAPVTLSQGEFTEVLSLTRPAGTWLYFAGITLAAAADCDMYALIYDGTTDRGSAVISLKAGQAATLSIVSDPITLASEGAISLQAYVPADTADGTAQATAPTVPLSTLTYLRCMRVG